ncbi:MAG: ORF6N domain-containing protein [Nitrospinae bacterium]|nr:ORF6N domain-containing protein [Nitrospinota bacterium]
MRKRLEKEVAVDTVLNLNQRIIAIRDQRVMLDIDLAGLFGVPTKAFNQAIKRNRERFPDDFVFQLTSAEKKEVVTKCDHLRRLKFSPSFPYAFTEHGAIMAANVLNSKRAIQASVYVVRAFVRMREVLAEHKELARIVNGHEKRLNDQDEVIISIVEEMRKQKEVLPPARPKRKIGFGKRE